MTIFILTLLSPTEAQTPKVDHSKIKEDLEQILLDLSQHYIYLNDKETLLSCIAQQYRQAIPNLQTEEEVVLFFELLLAEFYDSHLILNTNRKSSYRLYAPIYVRYQEGKPLITSVWQSQLSPLKQKIMGAEILAINGQAFQQAIDRFPTKCVDKSVAEVREWIANKVLAGRYNEARVLSLKLLSGKIISFDLDQLSLKKENELLSTSKIGKVDIIRINNSLGNNKLIAAFDQALASITDSEGLILDLRNTVDGGNSYVGRGIMSRFISQTMPYQKHWQMEDYDEGPAITRSWLEYVSPRLEQYQKPLVVLVGRWTGSMGEGLAIGLEATAAAKVVGTEMERLAGEMEGFSFQHHPFGYRLSTAKLFHVDGTLREKYIPPYYVETHTVAEDEILARGLALLNPAEESNISQDSLLKKELEALGVADQTLRMLLPELGEKFGGNSAENQFVWSLIHQQDSICVDRVLEIIKEHGWLGKSRIGDAANQALWLIIQHAPLATQEQYLPALEASVIAGESEGWHLAFLQDRVLMRQGEKQRYGSQATLDKKTGKLKIYPIEEVETVNERRQAVGLMPIETYAKENGYLFDQ